MLPCIDVVFVGDTSPDSSSSAKHLNLVNLINLLSQMYVLFTVFISAGFFSIIVNNPQRCGYTKWSYCFGLWLGRTILAVLATLVT